MIFDVELDFSPHIWCCNGNLCDRQRKSPKSCRTCQFTTKHGVLCNPFPIFVGSAPRFGIASRIFGFAKFHCRGLNYNCGAECSLAFQFCFFVCVRGDFWSCCGLPYVVVDEVGRSYAKALRVPRRKPGWRFTAGSTFIRCHACIMGFLNIQNYCNEYFLNFSNRIFLFVQRLVTWQDSIWQEMFGCALRNLFFLDWIKFRIQNLRLCFDFGVCFVLVLNFMTCVRAVNRQPGFHAGDL